MTDGTTPDRIDVTFQGASDDCIEISGCPGADEFYANHDSYGLFQLASNQGHLVVRVGYDHVGVWSVGFMPAEEGVPVPDWPIRHGTAMNDYTACLVVSCPADVTLTRLDARTGR